LGKSNRKKEKAFSKDELRMNRSAVKIQERSGTDLRHDEVDGHFLAGRKIEDSRIVGGSSCWSSSSYRTVPPPEKQSWSCGMMRWRRSTQEGSIYRTERVGADLTYLFAASMKPEGAQVDMVTVRMVIKGLCR